LKGEYKLTVENNKNEFQENEVMIDNLTENNKTLKSVKAKDFIDTLFAIIIENNTVYQN
jgi:hypothetical protein